jgi:two-component system phosphate regulon sensor histidine kinase PhoR
MKRLHLNLNLTGVILMIAVGVLVPVMLATAGGIVALVIARDAGSIVTGALIVSFAVTAAGCALIAVVLTSRKARLARLQADFVANVSHEFRTPLSAIKLYAQTLQSEGVTGDAEMTAKCLSTILRETEWLDVMINQVLTWRASARDMLPLRMERRSVAGAVNDAVERFRCMVPPDGLELTTEVESHCDVRHDARALNAVVLNLLTNASKYTGDSKRIGVRVWDEGDEVMIAVEDNGVGLTASEMRRVFEPFYRTQRSDGGEESGVGLGLAIAQHIVKRHGGTLTVASQKGCGSTFTVSLPVTREEAA